jgi:adenine-specific DNA-methyltransferase
VPTPHPVRRQLIDAVLGHRTVPAVDTSSDPAKLTTTDTASGSPPGAPAPAGVPSAAEKQQRGQFFTRHAAVHQIMVGLIGHRTGAAVEPSAGEGHLVAVLEAQRPELTIDAVELDPRLTPVCATPIDHEDFFTWAAGRDNRYQVAFGNPPYVAWKQVEAATRASAAAVKAAYSDKANLYHLFIDRCVDLLAPGGEMILIVPKEWLYTTSAAPLRAKLSRGGALTHVIDCGEEKLFDDAAVPALLIFRWVKQAPQAAVRYAANTAAAVADDWSERLLHRKADRWLLLPDTLAEQIADWGVLGDQYQVRVGLVTGADRAFKLADATAVPDECVQWQLDTTRQLVAFLNVNHIGNADELPTQVRTLLAPHESALRRRKIARFGDHNWWKYGAIRNEDHMRSDTERFFALAKTRSPQPFFTVDGASFYTGGVLGVFRKPDSAIDPTLAVAVLNSPAYRPVLDAMQLTSGDKVTLQPSTLMDAPFPRTPAAAQALLDQADTH